MPVDQGSQADEVLTELVTLLDSSDSGIAYIYDALDLLARCYELSDASIVVEDSALGPQAFRLGRKPFSGEELPAGTETRHDIMTVPDGVIPANVRTAAARLCGVALSLHVARHGAGHDPLTKLANRRVFDSALATAVAQSERYGWSFTLVTMDLNHLKSVNDSAGHSAGDDVLRSFGHSLRRSVRAGDTAARIGGDEFAVILGNAQGSDVKAFVDRLRALAQETPGADFAYGSASAPEESTSPVELFRLADNRLYDDKSG